MKFCNFINNLLRNLIPPKIQKKKGSKFKLDCVELKNSCILLIDIISFKLHLINFVYFFDTPGMIYMNVPSIFWWEHSGK